MEKITVEKIRHSKSKKISMLTAYDYSLAKIIDEAGVDIILVGDSLGNVIMGENNTQGVTMADMIHHTKAVSRGVKRALVVVDLPFGSMAEPVKNAQALVEAGAQAVKVEGIKDIEGIKAIVVAGIPVMGHLGLLPQSAEKYQIQHDEGLVRNAQQLEQARVFSIVLEMVEPSLAKRITETINVPTIGIGSGPYCGGQVLVSYDMLGIYPNVPKHAKKYAELAGEIRNAVKKYVLDTAKTERIK